MRSKLNPERFVRRIFVVDEAELIRRIPSARFDRLRKYDSATSFPEFAGQAVQFAVIDIGWHRGWPTEIYSHDNELLYFDRYGRLDLKREAERQRLGDRIMDAIHRSTKRRPFVGLSHPANRRYAELFTWKPPEALRAEIQRLALVPPSAATRSRPGKRRKPSSRT